VQTIGRITLGMLCAFAFVAAAGCPRGAPTTAPADARTLTVFCGAGIRPPMEDIRTRFETKHNCTLRINYEGSGTSLAKLQAGMPADLYIPGDVWWVKKAQGRGLIDTHKVAAWFVPVIAVQKGNPKGITGLADLARTDVKVGLGKAEACAVGGVARDVLAAGGLTGRVTPDFEAVTVNRLANHVKLKALDAAIIWDAVARQYPDDIDIVTFPDGDFHAVPFAVGVLKRTRNRDLAVAFADFAASDAGAEVFRAHHYRVPGTVLEVGSGGSMRPPVNELARLFERETGRTVQTSFAGSGELLIQMQESRRGDIYVCHDPYARITERKKMARRWHTVGYLHPTIAVAKSNPKNVRGLKDLLRPDLRVGVPHRRFSSCGQIIWATFKQHGMYEQMDARKPYENRSSGDLANQMKLGTLDVVVMWDALARRLPDVLELVPIEKEYQIDGVTSATTGQTYPVKNVKVTVVELTFSKEPLLAAQFARFATTKTAQAVWIRHGFAVEPRP